jgi:hypothetical protein
MWLSLMIESSSDRSRCCCRFRIRACLFTSHALRDFRIDERLKFR